MYIDKPMKGHNLNISRYISTATAEEEIDLAATHATLTDLDKKSARPPNDITTSSRNSTCPCCPTESLSKNKPSPPSDLNFSSCNIGS